MYINTSQDPIAFFTYKTNDGDIVDESVAQLIRRLDKIIEFKIIPMERDGRDVNVVTGFDHTLELKSRYARRLLDVEYMPLDVAKQLLQ